MKARTVAGRGNNSLRSDRGSEVRLGREKKKEKGEDNRWDEQRKKIKRKATPEGAPYLGQKPTKK